MDYSKDDKNHKGTVLDSVNGFDVIECMICGFKHITPIPSKDHLEDFYRGGFYSAQSRASYLDELQQDWDWWNQTFSELYDIFEGHLSPEHRRVLDVGSGAGFFLLCGKQRGWQTLGIEPSKQMASFSRGLGLDVVVDFFNKRTAGSLGAFDVVNLHTVLEHIPDPIDMLQLIRKVLNPGGLLCVTVANDYNPLQNLLHEHFGFKPWWVIPPEHINYFSLESLACLCQSTGFQVLHRRTTFPMEVFLLMGENYIENHPVGRHMHAMRKTFERNMWRAQASSLLKELYAALADRGIGRECVVIASR